MSEIPHMRCGHSIGETMLANRLLSGGGCPDRAFPCARISHYSLHCSSWQLAVSAGHQPSRRQPTSNTSTRVLKTRHQSGTSPLQTARLWFTSCTIMSDNSPNRAAGHFHFRIHAKPGAVLKLEFKNLDNVYNGRPGSVANELKAAVVSSDGRTWTPSPWIDSPATAYG